MKTFLAIIAYALSLFGIQLGHQVRIDRVTSNDTDVLYSKVVASPTSTRFECLRSASGQCYYTVVPQACAMTSPNAARECAVRQAQHFALAKGGTRQLASIGNAQLCVSGDARVVGADCE